MARHSHWAQIKLKKGALDKKRGKIFTRHAHIIEIAARKGGDENMNASLRLAIDNARADNMPRENIDRAIKKGTGELKGGESQEVTYEGYGPGGVALMIETLTDNKNRTSQMVRLAFERHGGNMGEIGSTGFLFEKKGMIQVAKKAQSESDELEMIDAGAEDIQEIDDGYIVYTGAHELGAIRDMLKEKGFVVQEAQLSHVPKTTMRIEDKEVGEKIIELLEALDELDDVTNVAANFEMAS